MAIVSLAEAVQALRSGEVVAFPTETVWGLGADATCDQAVAKIFSLKGRPTTLPLLVHVVDKQMADRMWQQSSGLRDLLIASFWPGPLAIIDQVAPGTVSEWVLGGFTTVGVRCPSHPTARDLLEQLQRPIAAPSANKFTKTSATDSLHVQEDFPLVPILDGPSPDIGLESTVVQVSGDSILLLRSGAISTEQLERLAPVKIIAKAVHSPGHHSAHYQPAAPLRIVQQLAGEPRGNLVEPRRVLGEEFFSDLSSAASQIYGILRDHREGILAVHLPRPEGLGMALVDRLTRAATSGPLWWDGTNYYEG